MPAQRPGDNLCSQVEALRRASQKYTVHAAGCALVAVLVPSVWKPLKLLGGTAGAGVCDCTMSLLVILASPALHPG
jgi:hypothetical protein